jgi:hypothetical protein
MLPSEADSQSAGFNLLPHATVGGVRIELTDTGAQNRRPTLGHPSANTRAKPPNLTALTRSLELESNEPLLRFRQALSPGQLPRVTVPHSRNAPRITAVRAGIEPAEGALTVRPVYQHTSPTKIGKRPMDTSRFRRTRETASRITARRHAASNCQRSEGTLSPSGALAGNRTLAGGLRTRCSDQ